MLNTKTGVLKFAVAWSFAARDVGDEHAGSAVCLANTITLQAEGTPPPIFTPTEDASKAALISDGDRDVMSVERGDGGTTPRETSCCVNQVPIEFVE